MSPALLKSRLLKNLVPLAGGAGALILLLTVFLWFQGETLAPWSPDRLPDLPATGDLPALSEAMENNPVLRARVEKLAAYDEAFLFVNYRQVNEEAAAILLLWAGANLNDTRKTREGIDQRIDLFLRAIYGFGPEDFIKGDPVMGDRPWARWFNHFKIRLLIQVAGQRVYKDPPLYDLRSGQMTVESDFSRPFMNGFLTFLEQQPAPRPFINNFIVFVQDTKGLNALSDHDRQIIEAMQALKKKS